MAISQIRINRMCFTKLCDMSKTLGGLRSSRNASIDEQVAIFLHIIAHNVKNRVIICRFYRSGETISRYVTCVCNAVLRLHSPLLKKPEPVPENSIDSRWKWFKNCLGALDGTYIKCLVPLEDKARYRTRKNDIATNTPRVESSKALVSMVNSGAYKADNGFKAGHLLNLEQVINQALPNSGLSGKPHIESEIRVMRKDWQIVYDLINGSNTSGFGYDTVTQSVVAEPEVWDAYIKVHKGAKKWEKKKFPYYEDLCIVFGKDRATGTEARDSLEIEEEVNIEQETQQLDDDDVTDDIVESSQIPRSHTSVQQEETSKNKNKKRKS